ncbi:amino acid adenylation domain-containing protein [Chryseobacterium nematophagum]|uniref:Amino acid adenylation domain-containing protein n=1 Tax=Chryseobacterium nematophagum TaxID=2305228 RepID=A0A3M7L7I5_9FLAO|nr:non-ribosomal peptide synthase/polyketide synthase [Chryseobacterium nematophagum]RMZ58567.1 amino acid adenylation domain-containing protein [Chryseobacterium nematophagum]
MKNPQFLIKLTPYQESFYHEWMLNPLRSDYNMTFDQSMSGFLDIERLNASLIKLINNHLLMNSNVVDISDELYWKNRPLLSEDSQVLQYFPHELSREELLDLVLQPFDLEKDQLVRFYAIQLNDGRYRIVYVFSHIIVDGLSTNSLYDEASTYYNDPIYISSVSLADQARLHEELSNQFDELFNKGKSEMTNFWKKHLEGLENIGFKFLQTGVLKEYSDPIDINKISEIRFEFEEDLFLKVKQLTRSYKLTPYTYGQMILAIALHRISGVEQLGIHYPIGIKEGQRFIFGAHVNTIIKGYHFTSETTLSELIDQNLDYVTDLKKTKGQYLPIAELIRYAPTSEVLEFSFVQANLKDIAINYEGLYDIVINNDLNIDLLGKIIFEQEIKENHLNYRVKYDTFELDSELVSQFIEIYKRLFVGVLHDILDHKIDTRISSYELLDKESYQAILHGCNATGLEYDTSVTLHELFERQVEKTPDHIALVYEDVKLSYRELNERSNQLAHYLLQNYQIQPDELIPLCLERSEEMLIAILGVLKSGGAYVPMDPSYPMDRIEHILGDTRARLVIVVQNTKDRLYDYKKLIDKEEGSHLSIISLNALNIVDSLSTCSTANPNTEVSSGDLSYVIYTSGTTGKPKGVMIEHSGVVNLVSDLYSRYDLNSEDVILQFANYVFDASVEQMFLALLHGNTLVLIKDKSYLHEELFLKTLSDHKVSYMHFTPSVLKGIDVTKVKSLRILNSGGEHLSDDLYAQLQNKHFRLVNSYGPTETTVTSIVNTGNGFNNIGRAISNTTVYVLDEYLRLVPVGAVGELYIGGSGLSRGYLNLPELTSERFLLNPFQNEDEKERGYNDRIYKTGDLVRFLTNGDIEYIGRNDFQVKIRGYRIELGEIENRLLSYEGIRQSVVLARDNSSGLKYLVGYYVSDNAVNHEDLSIHLSGLLPEYMVPSVYVHLDSLPLTINGKLDRKVLPEPNFKGDKDYIAPETPLQRDLAAIYGEVLGLPVESIGLHDDFFRLGGDSIISIQLVSRLRKRLSLSLSVKEVFTYRTVYHLSELLESRRHEEGLSLITEQGILEGKVSLLPIQKWFFHEVELGEHFPSFHHWNQSFMIHVPELDINILQKSLLQLVDKHDALRLYYPKTEHGYLQEYRKEALSPDLSILDRRGLSDEELVEVFTSWQSGFDIIEGPLLHVGYIHGYEDGSFRLHFSFHHLIIDAVSWRILTEDLQMIYGDLKAGKKEVEYTKGSSYRQWVDAIKHYKKDSPISRKEELTYWNSIIENTKNSMTRIESLSSSSYHHSDLVLDKDSTSRLLRDIHSVYHTQINDILLSAFSLALCDFTGLSAHGILLEGHGREDIFPGMDITETVGWFTTMYPIVLERGKDVLSTIVHTKESLRGVPDNGIGYGSLIGYTDGNLPRISFNYLGQLDQQGPVLGSWHIVGENSGIPIGRDNSDSHLLNINGAVVGGELYFGLRGYFSEEEMIRLSVLFKGYLEQLVNELSGIDRSYLTVSDVDDILSSSQLDSIQEEIEIDSVYLASSLQEGFIYHALSQGDVDDSYRVQLLWDYHGAVDLEKLKESWEYVQKKHPVLRTRFDWSESIVQVVDKIGSVDWRCIDLSGYNEKDREDKIKAIVQKDREEEYDLSKSGLFRVYLCQHSESHYTCIFSNHHAILDGWSMPVLFNDIHTSYLRLLKGELVASMVDISYGESQKYLQSHKGESDSFWKEYMLLLEDREDLSSLLKVSEKHTNLSSYRHIQDHQSLTLHIKEERYTLLKNLISKEGLTVNALLQYLWHKQLSIYSNQRTTVVGTTVSGRSLPVEGIESSVGLYINTLPLIVEHKEGKVMDLIVNLQSSVSDLNTYSDKSLSSLQDNGERLFSSLFVYENYPISEGDVSEDLDIRFRDSIEKIDYPLSLIAYERGEEVSLTLNYEGLLFERSMMSQVLEGMELMLDQLLQDSSLTTDRLSYVSALQYQDLIQNWNSTGMEYDTSATIHELFERQVEKTPDHIALVYEDVTLTYRELNERSNQLAHYLLQNYQIQPDELIPLCLERSEQMLIAILGVLKSGGAYVPMDPGYPMDRIEHILGDTRARLVLVEENTKDKLYEYKELIDTEAESSNLSIISLDSSEMEDSRSTCSTENPNTEVSSGDLSYVIYTSGTTGKPKGVMIEHKGVVNLVEFMISSHRLNEYTNVGCYSNYVFDAFACETFPVLCHGNTLWLYTNEHRKSVKDLNEYITDHGIEVSFIPPVLLKEVLPDTSLKLIFAGGESFPEIDRKEYEDIILLNEYGPSESTVCATYHHYHEDGNALNIGKPIANTTTYVLDEYLRPVPVGAVGELYIGGSGLSRGYLNLAELTDERFLENPFQSEEEREIGYNSRIYKTGDLVRFLTNGDIEYIGRNDFQVKIRGYRIELGEIESALLSYEGIRQSVVLSKEHNSGLKYLVGFYVSDTAVDHEELSMYLSGLLPEYMIPSVYVHLEELPMTLNGKLDRRALPEPSFTGDKEYIAPATDLEKQLADIYSEVLGLPVESIGIHDDFFRLGGNSIMAIKLISKIHQGLGLQANVAMVFSHKTVFGLAGVLTNLESGSSEMIRPIQIHNPEEQLLSFAQERLWFIDQYEGGSHAYNIPMVFGLSSKVDLSILEASFRVLLSRHEILRTLIITSSEGVGYQYVSDQELSIKENDVFSSRELEDLISQEITRVFDLSKELPISVQVFHEKKKDNKSNSKDSSYDKNEFATYISIVIHHIAFDGWSSDIFLEELRIIYQDLLSGTPVSLPSLRIQYKDFALWQRSYLQGEVLDRQLDYWKTQLMGVEPLNLPLDNARPSSISYEGNTVHFNISDSLGEELRFLSRDLGVSLYNVMLGGYYLLLSSYSGQKDIVLGTVVANRHHAGLEDLIGFFVNTLVLREEIDYGVSVRDFMLQVSDSVSQAQMHQDVPFEKLVEELGVVQDVSRHPLFQVMFGLQSFGSEAKQKYGEGSLFQKFKGSISYDVAKFDLSVMIDDGGDSLSGSFNYATHLFKESTIDHMISTYVYLLEQIVSSQKDNHSELQLRDLSWVRKEEYKIEGMVSDLLDVTIEYDTTVTLHELFERQVEKTPDHIALVYEDVKLTYRDLNERSNQLAHYLLETYKIQPDELIPLCLERSEEMLIGILGVLKSGGAYVPMDPNYPMDRIEHILGDTKARLVLVEENTKDRLYEYKELIDTEAESSNLSIISLNSSEMKAEVSTCSTANPNTEVSSGDLSYVIYTSGTTGKPKGVMIEHKSVVRLFSATDHWYGFTDKDVWSLFHSYVFDVSVWEMWGALLHGGKLLIPSVEQTKDLYLFFDLCYRNNLTVLCKTPTAFYQFIEVALFKDVELSDLRYVIFAGEALNFASLEPWYGRYSEAPLLINMYGTTETTVHTSYRVLDSGELGNSSMVGKSIPDQRIYVLDAYLRPVPVGAVGELYIGGAGLSRGYLNLAELTSERFLPNPFQSEEEKERGYNGRMYKTGDLGRYLPGGDLEYIGRNDFQVKIRGYRIELGEIENGLLSYEGIRQSVVLAKDNSSGLKYLVGYYVSDTAVNHEELSAYLSGLLPEYMVPSVYVHLEEFPLTINGKLDRKALPEPNFTGDKEYIAPTSVLEKQLVEIYSEVLGLPSESIGIHDDFFRLGGNSIMAIKLISKIHQGLGLQVSVAMVFSHKTIFGLAGVLAGLESGGNEMIRPIAVHSPEEQLLSFAQERLWFIDQYEGGSSAYNIPMVFGLSSRVDLSILKETFKVLLSRHEILRTLIITSSEGVGYQYVSDQELSIKETDVYNSTELEDLISQDITRVFDLSKDLPISVCVFHENDKNNLTSYISIVIHHIAFDGWSIDIFLEELLSIYQDLLTNSSVSLPSLPIQYKDFALWQRGYLQGDVLDRQLEYWKTKLSEVEPLNLPLDYTRPSVISYEGHIISFNIPSALSEELRFLSRDLGVSLYSIMLGGYYLLLSSYSGQKDIVLGTVVANRHHAGLEDLIGFFVNTLVLREEIDYGVSVRDFILQVSDSVSQAQMHQDVPFEKLVEDLGVVQDVSRHPLFQVMFGLQSFGSEVKDRYGDDSLFQEFKGSISYDIAKFDLSVMINDGGDSLSGSFNYVTHLFKESTIDHMISTYVYLLEQIVSSQKDNHSELQLRDLSWVRKEEYKIEGMVSDLLDVTIEYDTTVTLHELFERQVEKTPDHIALVYEDVKLTYRELNERSNQLAHYLLDTYQIKPDELIPLCLERSEEMLIGILGVLKSGGAYVPMDPHYPMDRIEHILGDTKARVVIGEENTIKKLFEYESEANGLTILSLNSLEMTDTLNSYSIENPKANVSSGDLSYVIYTSGTTGKPKGVMIEHKGVVNLICCMISSHRLNEYMNVGCYSNYVFDAFVYEVFPVLCHGNMLWLYTNELRKSVKELNEYINEHQIEVSFIPPVLLKEVLPDTSLKLIFAGGESFPAIDRKEYEDIILLNEYGPTESTVCATYHHYHEDGNTLNIGRPIANTTTYVLDEYLRPVPVGAVGELYIGGSGLSRGYLNLAELTSERFLSNPFQSEEEKEIGYNDRIYKTGDLGRYLPGGDLEYIGRNDFQVKIRGYRIELGEIESALLSYEGIRQAVVLAKEHSSGLKYLVGYYVSDTAVNPEDLSMHLSGLLPEYMVPSVYVHLEELPLTINGKLDRKSLPEPSFTGDKEYIAPTTALEKELAEIYGEVLGLPVENIGLHDDFFRLGGNSIMVIKLISKIHQGLGLQANVAMVFSHKTIFGLAGVLEDLESGGNEMIRPIQVHNPEEQLLSFAQERLWFIDQYEGGSHAYNIPMVFELSSKVGLTILEKSFRILLSRHEILRTLIVTSSEGVGYQYVSDQELSIKEADVYNSTELEDLIFQEITRVFDLSKELPISVQVFHEKKKDNKSNSKDSSYDKNEFATYISIVIHHIAFDGWSTDIFLEELRSIYQDLLTNNSVSLPSLSIQYKDFALWQRGYLQGEVLDKQLEYWKTQLLGVEPLNLPLDYVRPSAISYEGNTVHFNIADTLGEELRLLSRDLGVSLYSVMLGGYYLLLSSYSGQKDIVLGTVVANRHHAGLEDLIGFFVNTLVLREEIDYGVSVRDFILQVSDSVSQAQMHQDVPFEKLVEELGVVQDVSRHPLFQVMFGLQSFGSEVKQKYGEGSLFQKFKGSISYDVAKFDLSVMIDDGGDSLSGSFNYATHLFKESTIDHMISTYVYLLEQIISSQKDNHSELQLRDLSWVRKEEYKIEGMVSDLLDVTIEYDSTVTIHELFERQVEKTPDHIALVYEDVKLSYRELNERSNQLAHYLLQNYQIKPDELIPLCLERSEQMLIAILAVLKSGGAYVPMDPNYPMDRIEHILGDTKARVVLVEENTKDKLYDYKKLIDKEEASNLSIISLNVLDIVDSLSTNSTANPNTEVSSEDLSYVIYTSGTTGKPKGVMIEHKSVVRLFSATDHWYGFTDKDVWSLFHSYVFDVSVWEMWGALLHGGKLLIPSVEQTKDLYLFFDLCYRNNLTVLCKTPTAFYQFIEVALSKDVELSDLRYVIFAGEALNFASLEPWYGRYSEAPLLINMYGTTETTVHASYRVLDSGELGNSSMVGKSIPDQRIYVLDAYLRPVPVGAVGELYIGGAGLSRGYLNLAELTSERFLPNPFQSEEEKERGYNGRMYMTGDLGRYLPGGDLEYIGRNDFQVKIRGYRIELGEIENGLLSYEGIRQSVVLAKDNSSGLKYLVGYYVSDNAVNPEDLSMHLSGLLPEYMVPSVYVHLEEFPLTINGKLDRKALPEPNFTGDKEYIAPTTVLEKQLADIYGEVLGLPADSIGLHDDFFRLGGDSIISIQLVSRLRKRLSLSLSVKEVFTYRTVYHLSELLESRRHEEGISLITEQGVLEGEVSLLPIQEWFFHEVELGEHFPSFHHWNQSFMIHVPELDIDILKQSLLQLVEKHDALRLYYPKKEDGYLQEYRKEAFFPSLSILDRRGLKDEELVEVFTSWQSGFDIIEGPLLHVGYIHGYEDGSCRIHFCFHHLIIDAVSWRILTEDLQTMYRSLMEGNTTPDYVKGSSYRQWVDVVKTYKEDSPISREEELTYWNSIIENTKNSMTRIESLSSSSYHHSDLVLDKDSTSRLLRDIHGVYHTQINDILLSAFSLALCDFTGLSAHGILLEGHGREDIFPGMDITETVGWFTTMYPIVLERGKDVLSTIVHTKESLRGVPDNGIGYGSLIGYTDGNLPRISFNYLGQLDQQEPVSGSWHIVGENSGIPIGIDNSDSNLLNINGAVVGGELYFGLRGYFSEEEMIRLSVLFKGYLEQLVNELSGIDRSYLTVSDVDDILSSSQLDSIQEEIEIDSVYLASSLQEGFIYHALSQGDVDDSYRVQLLWDYHGAVDLEKLKESWEYVQKKHPILRTRFDWSESIVQVVDKIGSVDWRCIDLSGYDEKEREDKIKAIVQKDREEDYDLSKSGLFRVYLCQHSESHYTCIFSNHHAILDGWSMPVLFNDIHTSYLTLLKGEVVASMVDISYGESQKYLQRHKGESDSFWKEYMLLLEDREDLSSLLKVSEKHTNLSSYRHIQDHQSLTLHIKEERYTLLKNLISKEGLTVNAVLQYLWHKQLSIYSNQRTTVVGTTVSGRSLPVEGIESSVGLYINTLP